MEEEKKLQEQIRRIQQGNRGSALEIENELDAVGEQIAELEKDKLQIEANRRVSARVDELKGQERDLAAEYERLERELYLIEQFIRAKVNLLEEKINSKFELARFQLFTININGGLEQVCNTMYQGVPYNSMNNAARINVGLDICKTLSSHYGITLPVFVDNAEAVTDILPTGSQQIRLVVSAGDKTLRIKESKIMATSQTARKQQAPGNGNMAADNKQLMAIKKETADIVLQKVQMFQRDGELDLPPNYSAANALKSAWLILQKVQDKDKNPALEVCSKASIANALLDMVVQGLNPAKSQCYFIVYGNELVLQRSYFGAKAVALRVDKTLEDIYAEAVYKGDRLEYSIDRGRKKIEVHTQSFENIDDDNIAGAYATAVGKDGEVRRCEIMTMDQLKAAWKQSKMYPVDDNGNIKAKSTHGKFTAEMAKKTVTNRLVKHIINSSSDSDLVIRSAKRTDDERAAAEAQEEVDEYANTGEVIDIDPPSRQTRPAPEPEPEEREQDPEPEPDDPIYDAEVQDHVAAGSGPGF